MVFTTGIAINSGPQQKPPKTASCCKQVNIFKYPCRVIVDPALRGIPCYSATSLFSSILLCLVGFLVSWLQFEASYSRFVCQVGCRISNSTCSDSMNCPLFVSRRIIFMADHYNFLIEAPHDDVLLKVNLWPYYILSTWMSCRIKTFCFWPLCRDITLFSLEFIVRPLWAMIFLKFSVFFALARGLWPSTSLI
jgi:hypothetical protein